MSLTLQRADRFVSRLLGVWRSPVTEHKGLWLLPCWAVHTVGLEITLDVLFLDKQANIVRSVFGLPPNRCIWHKGAHSVVELPGGYCLRHPDYRHAVAAALAQAVE